MSFFLTATEAVEEVVEEVIEYDINDVYKLLNTVSNKLSVISNQLDELQETEESILQYFQSSDLDSVCALLLLLVLFNLLMIVKSWLKGVRNGRIS